MADRHGIELARCGQWDLSTGPLNVTPDMLQDAVRRATDAGPAFRAAVKLGHIDPRNDGEPAFGWIHNVRIQGSSADDMVLLGDVKDMPQWLADIAPSAYPDRSIEALEYKDDDGKTVGFELTGLSLLGVTPPGMSTIQTWRDLPQAFGVAAGAVAIAASFTATHDVAAAVSDKAWSSYSDADYDDAQYAKACVLDRGMGAGTAKQRYSLRVREPDGTLNRNGVHAAASALAGGRGGVSASDAAKKAAAVKLVGFYKNDLKEQPPQALLDLAGVKASDHTPPAEPPADPTNPKEADTMSDTLSKGLRERLGIAEDAELDEAQLLAKLDEKTSAPPTPEAIAAAHKLTTEQVTKALADAAKPADKTDDDAVKLTQSAYDELVLAAKAGAEARVVQLKQDRDVTIDAAFKAGKIAAGRKEHWAKQWDADPEGTKKSLEQLPAVHPVAAAGYDGAPDLDKDAEDQLFETFFPTPEKAEA